MRGKTIDRPQICDPAAARPLQPLPSGVGAGAVVEVRGARWRVDGLVPHRDCEELHLSGASDPAGRVLLWPFDRPSPVLAHGRRLRTVRLRAWRRILEALAASEADPTDPRVRGASADVMDYQLAPALAAASGEARLLLADEVGLGKTIQAGWIVADRLGRDRHARILLAVPAGVRHQWQTELRRFFDIEVIVADAAWLRRAVASLPADVNPWTPPGVYAASIDFLKRADVVRSLESAIWDVLVVDEAHMAAAPTDRHAAIQRLAACARHIVAITATPYSGDAAAAESIAAIGATGPHDRQPPPVMFRRSREDTGDRRARRHRFATVRLTPAEQRLQRLLERYTREVWRGSPADLDGARLAMMILRKRALSSAAAALRSLTRRLQLLRSAPAAPTQLSFLDDEDAIAAEDDLSSAALAVPGLADADREQRTLSVLVEAAAEAARNDSKARVLVRLLRRVGGEPAIVFTEYRDTLLHLSRGFSEVLQLHGGQTSAERAAVQARFNTEGRLLLATDAASCGLNLQHRCRLVVNYELPWNPARLEQRIGRVDRIGQRRTVHAVTLVARHTAEDLVIAPLARRLVRVASTLGERDRLASFLTDARTAGLVIGDAEPPAELPPAPALRRRDALDPAAARAAGRLRVARAAPAWVAGDREVAVSSMRASAAIEAGAVVVTECSACTEDGQVAGRRLVVVHLASSPEKPRSAEDVRERARALMTDAGARIERDASEISARWFEDAACAHRGAADRLIARERALRDGRARERQVQPGLFDRRAVDAADAIAAVEQELERQHGERIATLERGRVLRLRCRIAAVLFVCR